MHRNEPVSGLALQLNDLPLGCQATGQLINRGVINQQCEQLLIVLVGELKFVMAPTRGEPLFGNQEQHGFAASRRV